MRDVCKKHKRPTLGWGIIDWAEENLCHGPGDVQGEPLEIDDELAEFVLCCYDLAPDGRRIFDEALLSRPKGRAKTELAAVLVCAEALGPVRFAHWDERGEPKGRPVTYPFIRCLATEEEQSGNTYGAAAFMLSEGKVADAYPGLDLGRDWQTSTRTYLPGGGEIRPSTAASASKDGGKESFAVADEPHLYILPDLKKMYATVKRNLAKRAAAEPWMLGTSTMFRPGEESTAERLHEIKSDHFLLDHRGARRHIEFDDTEALVAELNYVYGKAAGRMDMARLLRELQDPAVDEADQRRYFLNERVKYADTWLAPEQWAAVADATKVVADGDAITLGFDGSLYDDATALVGCRVSDGHLFTINVWEKPDNAGKGWEVPQPEVDAELARAFDRYEVVLAFFDPAFWQGWLDRWSMQWPKRVVEWPTNRPKAMAAALERIHTAVTTKTDISHDGDSRLAQHVANARKERRREGDLITKERRGSSRKIDAAMAATLAYEARGEAVSKGLGAPKKYKFAAFR